MSWPAAPSIHLRNLPGTPRDDAWGERTHEQRKQVIGLGNGHIITDLDELLRTFQAGGDHLSRRRPRPCLERRTAGWMDQIVPRG